MTTTPTPAAPSLAFGEDSGSSDSDGVINASGPLLIGQTVPGATITLYDNLFAAGAANTVADANGYYAIYPYPVLDDGKHTLTITATAPGQTQSQYSAPLYLVVDTSVPDPPTAPVVAAGFDTGASAEDGVTARQSLQLTGTSEPGAVVKLYNGGNTTPLAQATVAANGSYTLTTATLPDAAYTLTVTATDLAGNVSTPSAASSITVDSKAPDAPPAPTLSPGTDTGVSHADGLTNDAAPVITGTAEANATVELFDGTAMVGKAMADGTGAYAITSDKLDDGAHALTVKAASEVDFNQGGKASVKATGLTTTISFAAGDVGHTRIQAGTLTVGLGSVPEPDRLEHRHRYPTGGGGRLRRTSVPSPPPSPSAAA